MLPVVSRLLIALSLAAAACGNPDNLIVGGASPTDTTPLVLFDNINSSIAGTVQLTDPGGASLGTSTVVILSDRPDLCSVLAAHPDYFRKPPEGYLAEILFLPPGRLGTFWVGRVGDEGTSSEIIAITQGGDPVTPFTVTNGGYIALTEWSDSAGANASGSFDLVYFDPQRIALHEFQGRFRATVCSALQKVLLP